jgi:hypothetical protein
LMISIVSRMIWEWKKLQRNFHILQKFHSEWTKLNLKRLFE